MKITYWSDYACPYCYIGETRLKKAIAQVRSENENHVNEPIELEMRAFRLDPSAGKAPETDTVTRFAKKYRMSPMLAAHQIEKISELGRREGLDFNYADTQSSNTFDAHRLTKLAYQKSPECAETLIEALFKAYFGDNKILADTEELVKIGVNAGLDEKEIREMFSSEAFSDEVLSDEQEAYKKGVTGVPYFEIDGADTIYGAENTAGFKRRLEAVLSASSDDEEKGSASGAAHVCGPDGCRIS